MSSNPVVLITGALSGIGRAAAFAFARDKARVVVSGRRVKKAARSPRNSSRSVQKRNSFRPMSALKKTYANSWTARWNVSAGWTSPSTPPVRKVNRRW